MVQGLCQQNYKNMTGWGEVDEDSCRRRRTRFSSAERRFGTAETGPRWAGLRASFLGGAGGGADGVWGAIPHHSEQARRNSED